MDLDGLEKLVKAHHGEVMGKLDDLEKKFDSQTDNCIRRFGCIENDVKEHDRLIQKSRGAVNVVGAIWAVVTAIAALFAPYFWR